MLLILILLFSISPNYAQTNNKIKEEVIVICNGELDLGSPNKKFVDEYKISINTLKLNENTNKIPKNDFIDYYKNNPIRNIELINSNFPAQRMINVTQELLKKEGGKYNGKLKPKNINNAIYEILYPVTIKKLFYSRLNFTNNIISFKYKFIHLDNQGSSQVQENISTISLNTGAYRSDLTLSDTEGKYKNKKVFFRYTGFCNVDPIISYLNYLKSESKGSFSYNYLFFLLIIIGITIFVYKQGPKKKRKTK